MPTPIIAGRYRNALLISFVLFLLAIEMLALWPLPLPALDSIGDKAQHGMAFAVLGLWGAILWPQRLYTTVLFLFAFGVQIEICQYYLPNRFFSPADIVADTIGLLVAASVFRCLPHGWRSAPAAHPQQENQSQTECSG